MFSSLVRKYFKHLFELNFEFTYQELIKEINTRNLSETFKKILLRFFDRSLVLEFSGNQIQKTEFRALIGEFKLILFLTAKEPLNIDDPELKPKNHTKLDRLYHEIAQAESYLRNNQIDEASTLYKKLHSGFDKLDHDHKQKIHSFVERLYHEINLKRHEMDN